MKPQEVNEERSLDGYQRFAKVLVLFGGILGLVISVISLSMVPFLAGPLGYSYGAIWQYGGMMMGEYDLFGYPQFGLNMMSIVMTVWSFLGLIGGSLSVFSGLKLRRDYTHNMTFISAIGAALLLLSFSWLPGLMVLVGSLLLHFA